MIAEMRAFMNSQSGSNGIERPWIIRSLLVLLLFLSPSLLIGTSAALDVSSSQVSPGDSIVVSGEASPGDDVTLSSSFRMDIPVVDGRYEYLADGVSIPSKPNQFTATASNVADMNVGVKMGIWLTKSIPASSGRASISQGGIPPGRYTLKVSGQAEEGASFVEMEIRARTTVEADSEGRYSLEMDTDGVPEGVYVIEGQGDRVEVRIGSASHDAVSSESESRSSGTSSSSAKSRIVPAAEGKASSGEPSSSSGQALSEPAEVPPAEEPARLAEPAVGAPPPSEAPGEGGGLWQWIIDLIYGLLGMSASPGPAAVVEGPSSQEAAAASAPAIPEPYYVELKRADADSLTDIIRFADSIRSFGRGMTVWQRAALYQWKFRGHGFNVTFAYADSFGDTGREHIWLLVHTRKGERIELEPSPSEMGASCMEPLEPRYSEIDREYADIYELCADLGAERVAWWDTRRGREVMGATVG
ncbi:MAG: hypothetical protein JW986_08705 [Methanotrichaceae archaeon]|nr:hypothetical protein [Methanotrichaceae archaeon]